ncbi:IS1249 family transposase [Glutamicibacter sp. AOP38-B1-38]|uniref:IS1249 family transposase n=1 Tax=Glutamicibacter sp. AOP38-B1-38 TaxID=3457680 RepID=UPI004033529E
MRQGWCLLIAIAQGNVIGWQWCDREKSAAWTALLKHFPEPKVVITDGGSGLMKAMKEFWPNVKIQRCLVHIQRNVRTYLTLNPRLPAGKSLRSLSLKLTNIRTQEAAAQWMAAFAAWHAQHQDLINERTYAAQWNGALPQGIRSTRTWWYTHDRLRKAYENMQTALRRGHLFTYLNEDLNGLGISSTTNMIEGAVNSGIRAMIFYHRGMPIEHRRRACEWFCWTHTDKSARPKFPALIKAAIVRAERIATAKVAEEKQIGPELYGTAAVAEEGLYARAGWGGRSR